jgi:phosphatidylethanolamine/phosphatidyl-N-methylethanolamine N-methyltransferase
MGAALDRDQVAKAYGRWAPIYDIVFGAVFDPGRTAAIAATERHVGAAGGRILEVGVGTGISLLSYNRNNRVVGVDISVPMLRRARERVAENGLTNVDALAVMDAKHLALPDRSFDVVVAQFVITAVPDPEATLDEFVRVLKPGGEIILVNHLGADGGMRWAFEQGFAPIARRLGWSPEFPFARLTDWAEHARGRLGVTLIERQPIRPLGHFSLIRFGKAAA